MQGLWAHTTGDPEDERQPHRGHPLWPPQTLQAQDLHHLLLQDLLSACWVRLACVCTVEPIVLMKEWWGFRSTVPSPESRSVAWCHQSSAFTTPLCLWPLGVAGGKDISNDCRSGSLCKGCVCMVHLSLCRLYQLPCLQCLDVSYNFLSSLSSDIHNLR